VPPPDEPGESHKQFDVVAVHPRRRHVMGQYDSRLYLWGPSLHDPHPLTDAAADRLLAQLADEDYFAREKAELRLLQCGVQVEEHLERADMKNAEVRMRVGRIRAAIESSLSPTHLIGKLEMEERLSSLAIHPDGRHWVAAGGYGAGCQLFFGTLTGDGLKIIAPRKTPHGPDQLHFSPDGRRLVIANRDGTIGVYRVD